MRRRLKAKLPNIAQWFQRTRQVFGTVPKPNDPNALAVGKTLFVDGQKDPVLVTRVTGNLQKPKMYEINGKYLISMLDFYTQLTENRRPTVEERKDWDSIETLQIDAPKPSNRKNKETLH